MARGRLPDFDVDISWLVALSSSRFTPPVPSRLATFHRRRESHAPFRSAPLGIPLLPFIRFVLPPFSVAANWTGASGQEEHRTPEYVVQHTSSRVGLFVFLVSLKITRLLKARRIKIPGIKIRDLYSTKEIVEQARTRRDAVPSDLEFSGDQSFLPSCV